MEFILLIALSGLSWVAGFGLEKLQANQKALGDSLSSGDDRVNLPFGIEVSPRRLMWEKIALSC
jgi:hypothetical protein